MPCHLRADSYIVPLILPVITDTPKGHMVETRRHALSLVPKFGLLASKQTALDSLIHDHRTKVMTCCRENLVKGLWFQKKEKLSSGSARL